MKKFVLIFGLIISASLCTYADNIYSHNDMFYQCLKNCTSYHWELVEESGNGNWHRKEQKEIRKSENGKCLVRFAEYASDEKTKANAADVDAAEIPLKLLKKINKKNFNKYFSKYNVIE